MTGLLAQIFPVILLALGIESGRIHRNVRLRSWWTNFILAPSLASALMGFASAVISTQLGGATLPFGIMLLVLLGLATLGLFIVLMFLIATDTVEEPKAVEPSKSEDEQFVFNLMNRPLS